LPRHKVDGYMGRVWNHALRPSGAAEHDPLSTGSPDRRLVEFFARYLERDAEPKGPSTLAFGTLGSGVWQSVTRWPPAGTGTQRWYLGPLAGLTRLLTFTSGPLPADVHILGFPVVTMRLATSGTDGAAYVYLEDVDPDGHVGYLTEGYGTTMTGQRALRASQLGTEPIR
jgi:predicted acyl esterase